MNPTHERLRPLIVWCAQRFYQIYGGSQEDIFQQAWLILLETEKSHDPKLGTLEKRAEYLIFRRLLDNRRREFRATRKHPPRPRARFDCGEFCTGLSDDAKFAARIIFGLRLGQAAKGPKSVLKKIETAGLSPPRAAAALRELAGAFN